MPRPSPQVTAAIAALVLGVIALVLVVGGGGESQSLHVHLQNASQLVKGDLVEVGGLRVGSIDGISLTDADEADIRITVDDASLLPLHEGTRAYVRSPSLSGVANRYIVLAPGPNSAPALADGDVIPASDTQAEVDLDALQSALDADTRRQFQRLIRGASEAYSADAPTALSRTLKYFSPGLSQLESTLGELVADRAALQRFIVAGAGVVHAVADRQDDVEHGLASAATTAGALARDRAALSQLLAAAPRTLTDGGRTLHELAGALDAVTPTARQALRSAPLLSRVTVRSAPVLRRGAAVLPSLRELLGPLHTVLAGLPALAQKAVPATSAATTSIRESLPLVKGTFPYVPDAIIGATNGFGGTAGGYYDANGDYARIGAVAGAMSVSGAGSTLPIPLGSIRFGNTKRCPGAATQVTPDGSNRFDAGVPCVEGQRP